MGAVANAGALDGRQRSAPEAAGMGVYELVRSEDAAGSVVDLEAGGRCRVTPPAASPVAAPRQRLVSLDVFRGITVMVRATSFSPAARNSIVFYSVSSYHIFLAVLCDIRDI
jgi:hypothetical protein